MGAPAQVAMVLFMFRKVVLIHGCATLQNVKAAHKVALLEVKQYHR